MSTHDPMCPFFYDHTGTESPTVLHRRVGGCIPHYDAGYAAALRDAVAAIYRTCGHTKYEGCSPCPHDEAVTAIKALRKEQK